MLSVALYAIRECSALIIFVVHVLFTLVCIISAILFLLYVTAALTFIHLSSSVAFVSFTVAEDCVSLFSPLLFFDFADSGLDSPGQT